LTSSKADARVAPNWEKNEEEEFGEVGEGNDGEEVLQNGRVQGPEEGERRKLFRGKFLKRVKKKKGVNELRVYVDPLKTSGTLHIALMGDRDLASDVELGSVRIPLGAALDCCGEDKIYRRWFPLSNKTEATECEKESDKDFAQYYTPCLRMTFGWEPADEEAGVGVGAGGGAGAGGKNNRNNLLSYGEASLSTISASLVDSSRAQELLTLSISDVAVKAAKTTSRTRVG